MDYDRTVYEEINLGNNRAVFLLNLIEAIDCLGYRPVTELDDGLREFVNWLRV